MSIVQPKKQTSFKEPGIIRVHQIHLRLLEEEFEIENRKTNHRFRYDEIEAFSTWTVSHYLNGQPQGISHTLRLWPKNATDVPLEFLFQQFPEKIERSKIWGVTVPFSQTHGNPANDPVFDELVEQLSCQVSIEMMERIEIQGTTPWVPQVHLTKTGVVFAQQNQPELFCRFDEIEKDEISDGQWRITAPSSSLLDLEIGLASINFYPGLRLFEVLRNLA